MILQKAGEAVSACVTPVRVLTSVFCVCSIFTAASASVVYLSFGGIPTDYAVLTFFVGLISTIIGQVNLTGSVSAWLPSPCSSQCRATVMR